MIAPSYGNLPFPHNHNAGEICKQVGRTGHRSSDFPGFFSFCTSGIWWLQSSCCGQLLS
ncbi:hypothetical protein RDI58_004199 [Solanum bulbocastanum]|uniref:Uncharacterized protein n=1 Tax=Solanum bulbocastanum TaxID=147425 RepID=A0AAN8YPQ7_SOLBU